MALEKELFQPSLKEDWQTTESYDIRKLFYISFFGGVIPTLILGTRNAKWLKINSKIIYLLIFSGIIIYLGKILVLSYLTLTNLYDDHGRLTKTIYKVGSVLLYIGYYFAMKQKFNEHLFYNRNIKPILRVSLLLIFIGIIADIFFLTLGVGILENFI